MLYLLHGGTGSYQDGTLQGDAERITEAFPFILVMPDTTGHGNYVDWYNAGEGRAADMGDVPHHPAAPVGRRQLLLVEDEADIANAVAARLRSEGVRVEVAADGPSGVARCEELQPDLVVLDLIDTTD